VVRNTSWGSFPTPNGESPLTHVIVNMNMGYIDVSRFNPQLKSVAPQETTEVVEEVRRSTIPPPVSYQPFTFQPTSGQVLSGRELRAAQRIAFDARIEAALREVRHNRSPRPRRQGRT
jgi:hypothetical protein